LKLRKTTANKVLSTKRNSWQRLMLTELREMRTVKSNGDNNGEHEVGKLPMKKVRI